MLQFAASALSSKAVKLELIHASLTKGNPVATSLLTLFNIVLFPFRVLTTRSDTCRVIDPS